MDSRATNDERISSISHTQANEADLVGANSYDIAGLSLFSELDIAGLSELVRYQATFIYLSLKNSAFWEMQTLTLFR